MGHGRVKTSHNENAIVIRPHKTPYTRFSQGRQWSEDPLNWTDFEFSHSLGRLTADHQTNSCSLLGPINTHKSTGIFKGWLTSYANRKIPIVRDGVPLDTRTYATTNPGEGAPKPAPIGRLKIRTDTPVVNRFKEQRPVRALNSENGVVRGQQVETKNPAGRGARRGASPVRDWFCYVFWRRRRDSNPGSSF